MDMFFIITTVVVVMIGALVAVVFYRVWRILKLIEHLLNRLETEGGRAFSFLSIFNPFKKSRRRKNKIE